MDIASLGIRIATDDVKVAVDALQKLAPAAAGAEKAVDDLAKTSKEAGAAFTGTSDATREASSAIDEHVRKLQSDAAAVGLTTKQVQLFTLAQKGATEAQLRAADSALSKTGSASAAAAIDAQVTKLQQLSAVQGLSAREAKLHELALAGASKAQLDAADSALKLTDAYDKGQRIGESFKTGLKTIALASVAAAAAAYYAANRITESIAKYKDLSEQVGDSASAVASLQLAADTSGKSIDDAATFSIKLTKALSKTDDESKSVGRGLAAIGLNFDDFKKKAPVEQLEAIAKALKGFDDGPGKTAALEAITKGGAQLLPFFNDLGDAQERQIRLTDEQIKRADDYSKAQARQASALKSLAEQIVIEALPAFTDLTGAVKDVIEQTLGIEKGATDLKGNHGIRDFAEDAALFLANVVDVARKVATAIQYVGETIGVTAAIAEAANRGSVEGSKAAFSFDPKGALDAATNQVKEISRIIADAREQGKKYSVESVSVADTLAKKFAARRTDDANRRVEDRGFNPLAKQVDTKGLADDGKGKGSKKGAVTEKDLLNVDLSLIKTQLDQFVSIYRDSESIVEATRSAGLIDEKTYYEAKLGFLRLNSAAQQDAVAREIASLQESIASRRGTAKDDLESTKKITQAEQKLADLKQKLAAQETVLGIQSTASIERLKQAYQDAQAAAESYLAVVQRAADREVAGVGKGQKARDFQSGLSAIDERFETQRQNLQRDNRNGKFNGRPEDYQRELALVSSTQEAELAIYRAKYQKLDDLQSTWMAGSSEAFQNYIDNASNVAKQSEDVFTKALGGIEDAFVSLATTGKLDFKSLANSIIADIIRIQAKAAISGLLKYFNGTDIGIGTNSTGTNLPTAGGAATGTNFVERDMLTIIHKGEAVVPKAYNPAANPGLRGGAAGGAGAIQVVMNNSNVQSTARQETATAPDGSTLTRLVIENVSKDISSGTGKTALAIKQRMGTGPGSLPRRN